MRLPEIIALRKDCFGAMPKVQAGLAIAPEMGALPGRIRPNQTGRFSITSYLQLRELDLLGRDYFGSRRLPLQGASSSSHSSFCEEVFSRVAFIATLAAASAGRLIQPLPQHECGGPDKYSGSWHSKKLRVF